MKKTIKDIENDSGLSRSTIDRVLNDRGKYSKSSYEKVKSSIEKIGYKRKLEYNEETIKLNLYFMIPKSGGVFFENLCQNIYECGKLLHGVDVLINIVRYDFLNKSDVCNKFKEILDKKMDGFGLFGVNNFDFSKKIDILVQKGVKVCTIISDVPNSRRHYYIGFDNQAAGATAAILMSKFGGAFNPSTACIAGHDHIADQAERLEGFRARLAKNNKFLKSIPTSYCGGNNEIAYQQTIKIFDQSQSLDGLYVVGGGNDGVIRALKEIGKPENFVLIVHDYTSETKSALADGLVDCVINQSVTHIARSTIRVLSNVILGRPIIKTQEEISIEIHLAENMPKLISGT